MYNGPLEFVRVTMKYLSLHILLSCLAIGCSSLQKSEEDRIRKLNCQSEKIYRHHDEHYFDINEVTWKEREKYPWEENYVGSHFRITKEFFRCKGSFTHPKIVVAKEGSKETEIVDCGGIDKHGLPFRDGVEFIYPILIDLLNYVQEKCQAKVVITSGHRCPIHNAYVDPSKANATSKHQIGAEVDFYVEGYEERPIEVVKWLMQFYREKGEVGYFQFLKCQKQSSKGKHPGWYNKEVALQIHEKEEGRDFDNRHPYPYITIEVRYDRDREEKVQYSWQIANSGYLRY